MHVRCTSPIECFNFTPTAEMLKLFNSENLYNKINEGDVDVLDIFPPDESFVNSSRLNYNMNRYFNAYVIIKIKPFN